MGKKGWENIYFEDIQDCSIYKYIPDKDLHIVSDLYKKYCYSTRVSDRFIINACEKNKERIYTTILEFDYETKKIKESFISPKGYKSKYIPYTYIPQKDRPLFHSELIITKLSQWLQYVRPDLDTTYYRTNENTNCDIRTLINNIKFYYYPFGNTFIPSPNQGYRVFYKSIEAGCRSLLGSDKSKYLDFYTSIKHRNHDWFSNSFKRKKEGASPDQLMEEYQQLIYAVF